MREATLLKLALTVSLIGIMGLFFLSRTVSVEETAISKIDGTNQERPVQITGIVKRVMQNGNTTFFTIEKQEEIAAVLFSQGSKYYKNITAGDKIALVGKVEKYKGKPEIIADIVRKIE